MDFALGYFMVAGGLAAGLQAARGVVRGCSKLVQGDARGAVAEVAGGLIAPAGRVFHEAGRLGLDVLACAAAIAGDQAEEAAPRGAPRVAPAQKGVAA
jgi:hypothetical protein